MSDSTSSLSSTHAAKRIQLILRLIGFGGLLATPAMLMPVEWMQQLHRQILPGELPATASINYLTRSLAMFYALSGLVTLYISFDVKRYAPLINLWGICAMLKGCVIAAIDLHAGYPLWWMTIEGLFSFLIGLWICRLSWKLNTHTQ
ncbi:hypothetical protein [Rubinisphaera italica]|uniref:DUF4345 domain-containing protein n=1 Tax=Rubinisphaera italica TaxID=2527969 RepID=A0A5C5XAY0_9PLAN|nr:hypothetical protein [Rubinisphaera italica]TWT60150.1 hypothetical protein Pan54_08640 [Rubinisphaera italica]